MKRVLSAVARRLSRLSQRDEPQRASDQQRGDEPTCPEVRLGRPLDELEPDGRQHDVEQAQRDHPLPGEVHELINPQSRQGGPDPEHQEDVEEHLDEEDRRS